MDWIGYLRRIMNKDASETFAQATDSLEALRDLLATSTPVTFGGTVTAIPGANQFTIPILAGLGAGKFADANAPWWALVFRDAAGAGAAPQGEMQAITAYVTATGDFTTAAFTAAVAVGDEIILLNPVLAAIGRRIDAATLDDMSALATASLIAEVKRVLLRLSTNAFTADIQGAARTELDTMLYQLATYIAALGAAYSATVNPGAVAKTNIEQTLEDLGDMLAGATGIVTFPAGAAAADGVSLAEVIRYIQETVLGYEGATALASKLTAARAALLDQITALRMAELDAANIPADVDELKASKGRQLFSMDFWGDPQEEVSVPAVAATLTLPSVTVADLPAGATIVRAIAIFKARMIENTNAVANKLDGATVAATSQVIQVQDSGAGGWVDAINFVDDQFGIAAGPLREGGDVLMGSIDIAVRVDANDTYSVRWLLAKADLASLNFNDVQVGLRIWYSV